MKLFNTYGYAMDTRYEKMIHGEYFGTYIRNDDLLEYFYIFLYRAQKRKGSHELPLNIINFEFYLLHSFYGYFLDENANNELKIV